MARLVVIQGTGTGHQFPIGDREVVIGRSTTADLTLEGANVSRKHASVKRNGARVLIQDMGSSNGTFVNDARITGATSLSPGDLVRIGSYVLRFEADPSSDLELTIQRQTAALSSNEELYRENAAKKLQLMLELSQHLARSLDTSTLLSRLVKQLLTLFPNADRALVVMLEQGELVLRVLEDRKQRSAHGPAFSRSVIGKVLADGVAVIAEDTESFASNRTLSAMGVRSLLCVPLQSSDGRSFGVVQLDRFQLGRPFNAEDLHLLTTIVLQVSIALENANLHQELVAKERIDRDLALAREIQVGFLPKSVPVLSAGRVEIFAELHPAQEVSGDFYDYLTTDGRSLALVVADVSGKGMPAALFMSTARALLRELATRHSRPCQMLTHLNDALAKENPTFMFITLILAVYDSANGQCTVARGGHPPAILRRGHSTEVELIAPDGCLLGIESPCPCLAEQTITLEHGDTLFFYTDGLTEAKAQESDEMFGMERLLKVVQSLSPKDSLPSWSQQIRDEIEVFTGKTPLQDDHTLLLLRRPAL